MITGWLLDSSAAARSAEPAVLGLLAPLLRDGRLWTCPVLDLEALAAAAAPADRRRLAEERALAYRAVPLDGPVTARALALRLLLEQGPARPPVPGPRLLVAAAALVHGLGVLHYDRGFERLGEVAGLAQIPVAPIGSLP